MKYNSVACAIAFSLFLFSHNAVFASDISEPPRLDNLSDPRSLPRSPQGTLAISQPCNESPQNLSALLSSSGQPRRPAQACLVKVDTAIESLAKGRLTIVDTRTAREFDKYRIPGALNLPAHAVKTKAFLKQQPFVLVDAGHTTAELESVCADLRRNGYSQAGVLKGGLALWKARGGAFEGDTVAARALSIVKPEEFIQEQLSQTQSPQTQSKEWLVIDVSGRKNPEIKKNFPGSLTVPWSVKQKNDKALLAAIQSAGNKQVLVIDELGDSYTGIEGVLRAHRKDVFYLDGGLRGYLKYQREQVAMWKQRDAPSKRKGCSA